MKIRLPNAHHGKVRAETPAVSEGDEAAIADSTHDAVQVVSISKSYGHRRHRVVAGPNGSSSDSTLDG
jgi:hypothetical protein